MKKYVFALSLIAALAACKKDEPVAEEGPEDWIVGYWAMTDLDVSGSLTGGGLTIPITGSGENYQGGYQLNANYSADYDASCDINIVIPGAGTQSFPFVRAGVGTWKLTNNNTVLEVEESTGQTSVFPIKVITKSLMILEQDSVINMAGFSGNISYEVTLEK